MLEGTSVRQSLRIDTCSIRPEACPSMLPPTAPFGGPFLRLGVTSPEVCLRSENLE